MGGTAITAEALPSIGAIVPERLQVTAPGNIIGEEDSTVYVTTTGSDHIVEITRRGTLVELEGDEKIAALRGITLALRRDRGAQKAKNRSK